MSIKPILFNTDMVRAILDGRKTVTRRIVKSPYFVDDSGAVSLGMRTAPRGGKLERQIGAMPYPDSPYRINDILYVRETWCFNPKLKEFYYKANRKKGAKAPYVLKWRPSIHMPKKAARIWLKVTDVRVERLQDITDDGCMQEGIQAWTKDGKLYKYYPADKDGDFPNCEWSDCPRSPMDAMIRVWNSTINKSELSNYGWDANPWVWVIEFERCEKPEE